MPRLSSDQTTLRPDYPWPVWFRKWCQRRGKKPYQVAPRLGWGPAACYAWANGGRLPLSKVALLAPRLGVSARYLRTIVRADHQAREADHVKAAASAT